MKESRKTENVGPWWVRRPAAFLKAALSKQFCPHEILVRTPWEIRTHVELNILNITTRIRGQCHTRPCQNISSTQPSCEVVLAFNEILCNFNPGLDSTNALPETRVETTKSLWGISRKLVLGCAHVKSNEKTHPSKKNFKFGNLRISHHSSEYSAKFR